MTAKNRRKQIEINSEKVDEMPFTEGPEAWPHKRQFRHKWFRKRKNHRGMVADIFDNEVEEATYHESDRNEHDEVSIGYTTPSADSREAGEVFLRAAARENAWGMASAIDIYNCDPQLIRDAEAIRRFVVELCDLIEMKRFGDTQVVHFGEDERVAGYSMVQLIETSLISGHFANLTNAVYLDVFSCKPYNPQVVREFSQKYFKGAGSALQVALRR